MDIEDFNNLEAKDFLKYKAPEFPWTKTIQETEMLENKELKEETELVRYATLSSLLRKAKDQKVKQTEDHYAEVSVKAYCGGPFELKISYANSDEDEPAFFYVTFDYEDDEDRKPSIEIRLYDAIKGKFREAGLLKEMQAEDLHVESSEIQKLEDIANGQGFLFENKNSDKLKEAKKLKEARVKYPGRDPQIDPTFIERETSIFFDDRDYSKVDYNTKPMPKTFKVGAKKDFATFEIDVAINGDYVDDILINTFFDSRCGYGYVIQAQTLEGYVEWAGFDRSEFREDLEDAYLSSTKFFETNKDKHTLETRLNQEFGRDKAHDTLEKLYQQGQGETFTKLLSREEFDAYKSSLNESEEYKYQILKSVEIKNLDKLKATVKETSESMGKDDAWVEWMTYASKLGRKYLGNKAGCDLGDDSHYYEAFENKLEISPYQTYSSQSIDRMIAARLACIKED